MFENSVDLDHQKPADLDLNCFQKRELELHTVH